MSLGKSVGLEKDSEDVEELMKDHNVQLTTEEMQDLHKKKTSRNCLQRRRWKTARAESPRQTSRNCWGIGVRHTTLFRGGNPISHL